MPRAFSFTDIDRGWHLDAYQSSLSGSDAVLDGKHYDVYSGYQCGVFNLLGSAEAVKVWSSRPRRFFFRQSSNETITKDFTYTRYWKTIVNPHQYNDILLSLNMLRSVQCMLLELYFIALSVVSNLAKRSS